MIDRGPDSRIRYGGAWFSAASGLPLGGAVTRPRPLARLIAAAARRPARLAALIALLLRTPSEYVVLSGTSAGRALDEYFSRRLVGVLPMTRFCQGVLTLPRDHSDYLRGRHRQALRTNLRRAASAGIKCEVVTDPRCAVDETSKVWRRQWSALPEPELQARLDNVRASVGRSELTIAVARDRHGRPLAMVAVVIDETVCLIKHAVATSHEARWALHDHIARILIAQRVEYLLADGGGAFGALGFATSVQHYQHLLGYELRHVIPVRLHRAARRRRRLALAVVTASLSLIAAPAADSATVPKPLSGHRARSEATVLPASIGTSRPRE